MEKLGLNEIRELFQNFYISKGHYKRQSFSLIPENDKSLLIINSGMAPLKPYFAGLETPPSKRMTTCQKCIRTGDIDNVGHTSRHGTFFEMLGSFSFGDYFKKESLTWGWEFITEVLKMPEDKVWATVYEDDEQAVEIWKSIGMPAERIVRLGKDDNFWEIGTGPCGPCSEIYYDRGEEYGCGSPDCKPGCECDRYIEFWNHVFTQFSKDDEGNYSDLAHPNIDTGMGLERLACIMQGVDSIFDIDTIKYILDGVVEKSGIEYGNGAKDTDVSIRIITDHIRSLTFMIADGIMPSNEGRGYVLRRLLRRAARHGRILGITGSFLPELADRVIKVSGKAYPELEEKADYIKKILSIEEEKFNSTIDQGTAILDEYMQEMKAAGTDRLEGEKAFKLYDTYGFPIELTKEILEEQGYTTDIEEFESYMEKQKETARAAIKDKDSVGWKEAGAELDFDKTQFTGYETKTCTAKILAILKDNAQIAESDAAAGEVSVILDSTPFYAESGGQVADTGIISTDSAEAAVTDVQKTNGIFVHKVTVNKGTLKAGDEVKAAVDLTVRNNIARNHTATHLLHKALKEVLGNHVNQAGSKVTRENLRFDFSHYEAVSKEDLAKVEALVNAKINEFTDVETEIKSAEEAIADGATALFGEKYGDTVRVIKIGDFSKELCGGTHVSDIGEIGAFKITSESGVAAGVRRIEAVTGYGIYEKYNQNTAVINETAEILKTNPAGIAEKAAALAEEVKALKKEIEELKKQAMGDQLGDILAEAKDINGVKLITKQFDDLTINDLRTLSDDIKASNKSVIMVFAAVNGGKVTFMVSITDDLLDRYHAGNMIKKIAAAAGGGGGGKADMAQAGAKDPGKVADAFKVAETLI